MFSKPAFSFQSKLHISQITMEISKAPTIHNTTMMKRKEGWSRDWNQHHQLSSLMPHRWANTDRYMVSFQQSTAYLFFLFGMFAVVLWCLFVCLCFLLLGGCFFGGCFLVSCCWAFFCLFLLWGVGGGGTYCRCRVSQLSEVIFSSKFHTSSFWGCTFGGVYLLACQVNRWELKWSSHVFGTSQVLSERYLPWPCLFQPFKKKIVEKLSFELITMRMPLPFNHNFFYFFFGGGGLFFVSEVNVADIWTTQSHGEEREKKGGVSNFWQRWRYAHPPPPHHFNYSITIWVSQFHNDLRCSLAAK